MSQAEYYTLQYATHLLSRQATWQLGCEYLAWCPTQGAAAMEAALERLPHLTEDSRTAYKVRCTAEACCCLTAHCCV
jgi:hypothetical protein